MLQTDPLSQHLTSVRSRLWEWGWLLGPVNAQGNDDKLTLAYRFLHQDIGEAAVLLALIEDRLQELRGIFDTIRSTSPHEGPRTIDPQSAEGQLYARQLTLSSEMQVLIKAAYEWLYHIHDDLERERELKVAVPHNLWQRLDAYCTFRSELLTHKKLLRSPDAAMRWSAGYQKTELLLVSFRGLPSSAQAELRRLFAAVGPHLSPAEAAEQNLVEQISILYSHLGNLPNDRGDLKADIKRFIAQHGAVSDSPEDLAEFLASLTTALPPPRSRSSRSGP